MCKEERQQCRYIEVLPKLAHTACRCFTFSLWLIFFLSCGFRGGENDTGAGAIGLGAIGALGEVEVAAGTELLAGKEVDVVFVATGRMAGGSGSDISLGAVSPASEIFLGALMLGTRVASASASAAYSVELTDAIESCESKWEAGSLYSVGSMSSPES